MREQARKGFTCTWPHVRESGFRNLENFAYGIRNQGLWNTE